MVAAAEQLDYCQPNRRATTLIAKNQQVIAADEGRIAQIRPGTANGQLLLLAADSPTEMDEVIRCNDSTVRAPIALSRDIDRALERKAVKRSACAAASRP